MDILIISVNSDSGIIENLKISTTPFSNLKAVKNLSYAQILNQIAHFDHKFMTVEQSNMYRTVNMKIRVISTLLNL